MDIDEFRHHFAAACELAGGRSKWGKANGVTPSTVTDILSGRRDPGPAVLKALGLEKVTIYQRKEASDG